MMQAKVWSFVTNVPDTALFFIPSIFQLLNSRTPSKGNQSLSNSQQGNHILWCVMSTACKYLRIPWPWILVHSIETFDKSLRIHTFVLLCHLLSKAKHYVIFIPEEWPSWMIELLSDGNPTNIFVLYYGTVYVFFTVAFVGGLWQIIVVADAIKVFFLAFVKCHAFHCRTRGWSQFLIICQKFTKLCENMKWDQWKWKFCQFFLSYLKCITKY